MKGKFSFFVVIIRDHFQAFARLLDQILFWVIIWSCISWFHCWIFCVWWILKKKKNFAIAIIWKSDLLVWSFQNVSITVSSTFFFFTKFDNPDHYPSFVCSKFVLKHYVIQDVFGKAFISSFAKIVMRFIILNLSLQMEI